MSRFPRISRLLCVAGTLSTAATIGLTGIVTLAPIAIGPAYAYCDGMRTIDGVWQYDPHWCPEAPAGEVNKPGPFTAVRPLLYNAIAISKSSLRVGFMVDAATLQEAQQSAVDTCIKSFKASDCVLAISARDNVCIAIAISGPGVTWGVGWGINADISHGFALNDCQKKGGTSCSIKQTVCGDH
jgi:hypothetical protein